MEKLKFKCLQCGICCYEIEGDYNKRIPVYTDEVDMLIDFAENDSVPLRLIEDLVFPDRLNKEILVLTYKIDLKNEKKRCPFYIDDIGCSIQNKKPLSCQSYPLSLKQIDAFNFQINIDPLCNFVNNYYETLSSISPEAIKNVFNKEYKNAIAHLNKNKRLMVKIRTMEYKNEIEIIRSISIKEYNYALKNWERREIKN